MTASKKSAAKPVAAPKPAAAPKGDTITLAAIAKQLKRSPKTLRAIARADVIREGQGKDRRFPKPVAKHVYNVSDVAAINAAVAKAS